MRGFFNKSSLAVIERPDARLPQCGACGLFKTCKSPKMPPSGKGRKKVLVVAEAPGKEEDAAGVQLVGNSGRELTDVLWEHAGLDMRRDCVLTNSLICRPPDNQIPAPAGKYIGYCRPNVFAAVEQHDPEVIILLGSSAAESVLGRLWGKRVGGITRWAGYQIPCREPNAWVVPAYHPAALLHSKDPVQRLLFERQLASVRELVGTRPWGSEGPPDYDREIEIMTDPDRAAAVMEKWVGRCRALAFDYETTTLKPDGPHAAIYSCSFCFEGKQTIAFPWVGKRVKRAARALLTDPKCKKIASNAKFEQRWTMRHLGCRVEGWAHDTMLVSHAAENADRGRHITSIKFQAFVRLGLPPYDRHVEPYLKEADPNGSGNSPNRIKELDLIQLLRYNAMDSLVEYKVAVYQMRKYRTKEDRK